MTTANFCFHSQNRLIQTSQTGGQQYSDTSPFSIPWPNIHFFKEGQLRLVIDGGRESWVRFYSNCPNFLRFFLVYVVLYSSGVAYGCSFGTVIFL